MSKITYRIKIQKNIKELQEIYISNISDPNKKEELKERYYKRNVDLRLMNDQQFKDEVKKDLKELKENIKSPPKKLQQKHIKETVDPEKKEKLEKEYFERNKVLESMEGKELTLETKKDIDRFKEIFTNQPDKALDREIQNLQNEIKQDEKKLDKEIENLQNEIKQEGPNRVKQKGQGKIKQKRGSEIRVEQQEVGNEEKSIFDNIIGNIKTGISNASDMVDNFIDGLTKITETLSHGFNEMMKTVSNVIDNVVNNIQEIFGTKKDIEKQGEVNNYDKIKNTPMNEAQTFPKEKNLNISNGGVNNLDLLKEKNSDMLEGTYPGKVNQGKNPITLKKNFQSFGDENSELNKEDKKKFKTKESKLNEKKEGFKGYTRKLTNKEFEQKTDPFDKLRENGKFPKKNLIIDKKNFQTFGKKDLDTVNKIKKSLSNNQYKDKNKTIPPRQKESGIGIE